MTATGSLTFKNGTEVKDEAYGKTVSWYYPSNVNLDGSINWYAAEEELGSSTINNPGVTAKFAFSLDPGLKKYNVHATGRVRYYIGVPNNPYPGYGYSYYWTDKAKVAHTLN